MYAQPPILQSGLSNDFGSVSVEDDIPTRFEVEHLLRYDVVGADTHTQVQAAICFDEELGLLAARMSSAKNVCLKRLLDGDKYEALKMEEWVQLQDRAARFVQCGTYAHLVLKLKYQDLKDMEVVRMWLEACKRYLATRS